MPTNSLEAILYSEDGNQVSLQLLDQRKLPLESTYTAVRNTTEAWTAIKDMAVRGAPAIAITGALALAVELQLQGSGSQFSSAQAANQWIEEKLDYLVTSRPTAVNLSDAAKKLKQVAKLEASRNSADSKSVVEKVVQAAKNMMADDIQSNKEMGESGADAIWTKVSESKGLGKGDKIRMLTHCNTGSLATAGYGTALGVIRTLYARGLVEHVYCTETRPYNQGARLTAYELVHDNIPATLIADSAAAALMAAGRVDAIVVGADRIAANGDTANKIGTYSLAVHASQHKVPFYIAAPRTTLDPSLHTGEEIKIEEREPSELTHHQGKQVAALGIQVWNPSFDVTPASLITGIITEAGLVRKIDGTSFDVPGILGLENGIKPDSADSGSSIPGFYALDLGSVKTYLADRPSLCAHLGDKDSVDQWQVKEVGDGNINYVYIVEGPQGALVVKQGLPYIRIDHSWKLTQERARIEANALAEEYKHCPDHVPTLYHFDPQLTLIVMQYLAPPHDILRRALVAGSVFPKLSTHVASFLAKTLFKTSLLNLDSETYRENLVKFANKDLCKLTEQVIFTDPYYAAPVNRHTSPQLDDWTAFMRSDPAAKAAATALKAIFMERQQALLHGDLHTGSFMVTEETTYAIDAEFAFYGPIAFDICKMIANLLLAFFASYGQEEQANASREDQRKWILQSIQEIWDKFIAEFTELSEDAVKHGKGGQLLHPGVFSRSTGSNSSNLLKEWQRLFRTSLLNDTLGFAGAVIIRRILGIAHVIDFESIKNADSRARCEGKALLLGYQLLVSPPVRIDEVIELAISLQSEDVQSVGGPSEQIRRYYRETA